MAHTPSALRTAPRTLPSFPGTITAPEIESLSGNIQKTFNEAVGRIIEEASSDEERGRRRGARGWDETFGALSLALGEASSSSASVTLPSMTHADPDARSASSKAKDDLKAMFDSTFARPGLFRALLPPPPSSEGEKNASSDGVGRRREADERLTDLVAKSFRRNGCSVEHESDRKRLAEKREAIEGLCTAFSSALNENTETLTFAEEELDGVDDLSQFPPAEGTEEEDGGTRRRAVSLKAPDTMPVLQFAKNPATRRAVAEAMAKKCQEENTSRFLEALELRHECATILGYPSHAHYMLETKMAGTPDRAEGMVRDLLEKLKCRRDEDLRILSELKLKEEGPDAGPIEPWDVAYYVRAHKASLGVDEREMRKYFPLGHVKGAILRLYEELLGLTFVRVEGAAVWHPDVECYAVRDDAAADDDDGDDGGREPLGYFYLDLFPRDGKYSHQCVYPLRPSYVDAVSGRRVPPACANIGNLSRPGPDGKDSLLRFREVETFFHEFGHVMHCVLTESEHSLQSWAWSAVPWPGGVEQDFLEVPSMMLENFVWEPEVLRRLSKRPEDGASLPEETIEALSRSRYVMQGYQKSRYLAMALYDLIVHSGPGPYEYEGATYDAVDLYKTMMTDLSGVGGIPGAFPVASWYHPMMGYEAGYYGYVWSEAYAADLFGEFERTAASKGSALDAILGRKYRETILAPCAMLGGDDMLRMFLDREPSVGPFLKRLGV